MKPSTGLHSIHSYLLAGKSLKNLYLCVCPFFFFFFFKNKKKCFDVLQEGEMFTMSFSLGATISLAANSLPLLEEVLASFTSSG